MGRLQRKKTAGKKSKKASSPATTESSSAAAPTEGATSSGATSAAVKKQTPVRKKMTSGAKVPAVMSEKNYLNRALQFLREVKVELKKVTWPTRKQTIGSTAVVIVLVVIISLFLGAVDIGLSSLIRIVLK